MDMHVMMRHQHGVITRSQVHAAGRSDRWIRAQLRRGTWTLVHPGVYGAADVAPTPEQAMTAALLAVGRGAFVSHRSGLLTRACSRA